MTNKRFVSLLAIMFLLFTAVFANTGCGGGGSGSTNLNQTQPQPNDSNPNSDPTPSPETEPTPENSFTIAFDSNGGSSLASQTVKSGEKAIEPTAPTKDGYTFGGWYRDSALTERFSFNTPITANITLYARWNAPSVTTYTVTFNSNGGSSVQSQNVVAGEWAVEPAEPTRNGYTFAGWYVDVELTEQFAFSTPITKHIMLYAKWEENKGVPEPEFGTTKYSVVFDSDGGTEVEEQTVIEEGNAIRPDDPEKDGYVFLTWRDDEGYVYDFGAPVYSNIFLTAEWGKLANVTNEEAELFNEAYIGGETFISFDDSPIASVEVQYTLDGIGTVEISEVTNNPMCNTAGLIGSPVEITAIGANVENAEIIFHYDPSELAVAPNDFSIAWYDSSNDRVVLLSEDTVIDTENNVIKVLVNHFSTYGLVSKSQWHGMWERLLPISEDIHYSIIFVCEYYADMGSAKILIRNLVDILNKGDCVTGIVFKNSPILTMKTREINFDYINIIRSNVLQIPYSDTGFDRGSDMNYALNFAASILENIEKNGINGKFYQPILILFSAGLASYHVKLDYYYHPIEYDINPVYPTETTYQRINKINGIKVITVGTPIATLYTHEDNGKINESNMQSITDHFVNSSYTGCISTSDSFLSNEFLLQEKFSDMVAKEAEKKPDTDKDGLPDALEKEGMRDQYHKIWSTDFTLVDTDGDGLSDDVEMGKYVTDFSPFYFKRFSNPNKTTKIESGSSCTLPSKVNVATKHRGEKMLYLTVNLKSFGYKDFEEYEAFFQPVKKLEFDITDLPEGFELKTKNIKSSDKQRYIGGYIDKDYILTAGIAYEDESIELNAVNLKLTIDDMTTYNELSIDRTKTYVNSKSLKDAKSAAASVTGAFIGELQNEARNVIEANAHDDSAANRLKKQMTPHNMGLTNDGSTPPDEVYTAFARAVLRAIEDCNINDYSYKIDKMGVDLMLQVMKQLMGNRTQNYTLNINNVDYNVTFDIHTMSTQGAYTGFGSANISWYDKTLKEHKWLLTWTTSQRENYEALANYCSVLDKLENSTVKQFFVTYINTAFKLVGVDKKIKIEHLEKAELIIRALCGDKEAGKELSLEVLGKLDDKYHELLKNFVKKNIPGGEEFLTAAEKLNKAREKRDDFQSKITEYAALSESEKTASNQFEITEKAYSELKSAYDSLSGIDIFEGFIIPSSKWPSWF